MIEAEMKPHPGNRQVIPWTPDQIETLRHMWMIDGATASVIAMALGFPKMRMAVIGKANRLGLNRKGTQTQVKVTAKKVHGNANKPSTEVVRKARDFGPKVQTDSRFLRSTAWEPLPGTTPVPLEQRTGCAWPVTDRPPHLFCDQPKASGKEYCEHHLNRYYAKPEATK